MVGCFVVVRALDPVGMPRVRCVSAGVAMAVVLGLSPVPAQAPAPAPAPAAPVAAPAAAAAVYGRVLVDGAKLRCWPSVVAAPPVFEDTLAKDQVVQVARSEGGFRCIVLPLGPTGYVSKKFTAETENGKVSTKGTKVAFRYKPRSNEAPVTQLADGQELAVIGEHEDWWRVRVPGIEAWLPEAEVQLGDPNDAALAAAFAESKAKYEAEVAVRLQQIEQARQRAVQDKADEAALQLMQDAFTAELKKPIADQQYAPIESALDKFEGTLQPVSSAKATLASLRQRIQAQKWIVEATMVRDSKPVPGPESDVVPQPKDELEKFQSIGWLRYETRLGAPGQYFLEKGGQRQHLVSCSSGRYDLALFLGREVGLIGPRRRPATESLSVLDVERLEVLGRRVP